MGFESEDCETIDTDTVVPRYEAIARNKTLVLGATRQIDFDLSKDFTWYYDKVLPRHPNGMIFSVYDGEGALLVSSNFYSIGGGFIIDETAERSGENMFYKQIRKSEADPSRRAQSSEQASEESDTLSSLPALAPEASTSKADQEPSTSVPASKPSDPPFLFTDAKSMLELCTKNNLSIAQLIWNNERHWLTDPEIKTKLLNIYTVMDQVISFG